MKTKFNKLEIFTLIGLSVAFFIVYGLVNIVNHYLFRTNAFDLGYYNKALYDFSKFNFFDFSLSGKLMNSIFADHFCPSLMLFTPLRFLFGSYTLLIVQNLAIVAGAFGAYFYIKERTENYWLPFFTFLQFGMMYPIFSSLSFDFHDSVIAAMALPWLLLFFSKNNFKAVLILLLFILGWKESLGIWMAFVFASLFIIHFKNVTLRKWAIGLTLISLVWTFSVVQFIMPIFDTFHIGYRHFNFSILGENGLEVLKTIFTRPHYAINFIWESHVEDIYWAKIKLEFLIFLGMAGGLFLFIRPAFLLMALPIILQKVWNDDPGKWGVMMHYGIELVPVVALAVGVTLAKIKKTKIAVGLAGFFLCLNGFTTFQWMVNREPVWYVPEVSSFLHRDHYSQSFSVSTAYKALDLIPDTANISTSSTILPHLAFRKNVDLIPNIKNAEYVIVLDVWNIYPFTRNDFYTFLYQLKEHPDWEILLAEKDVYVFKRKRGVNP